MTESRSNFTGIAFGLSLAAFAAYQQFKMPVALPVLLDSYGYDRALAGGFMSIYAVAGLLFSIALGRRIDRQGPGNLLLGGLGLFIVGCLFTLLVPQNGWLVLLGRGLEGLAFAVLAIAGPVLANGNAAPRHLPLVVGLTATWIPVGQLSATALAQAALPSLGWQVLWWVAIAGSLVFGLWTLQLRASGRVALGAPDPSALAASADPSPKAAGFPPAARLSLMLAGAVFMLWSGQYFAYMTWLPQYLVEVHGLGVSGALLGYVIPVSLVIVFCVVTGTLLRLGVPLGRLLVAALGAQAAAWALVPLTGSPAIGLVALVLYGSSAGIVPTCLFAMPTAVLARREGVAPAFGIVMTGRNLGVLMGPVLLAQTFKLTGAWDLGVPLFGGLTGLCFLLGFWLSLRLGRS